MAVSLISPALADPDDTFNVYFGIGGQRDNNLFRQSANGQSDTLQTTSLTLALSKLFAQQRFSLDVTLIDYRYSKNNYLDYQAKNYNAAWSWALTHRLTGILSSSRTEVQNSFVDYSTSTQQHRKNVRQTDVNHFGAEWQVSGGWRLLGGLTNTEEANGQTFSQQNGYALNSWEAGGKYIWPAGSTLQVLRREGAGEYKDQQLLTFDQMPAPFNPQHDTGFHQIETEARLFVPVTGKSSLSAMLANQAREHEHFSQRDYAVNVGRLDYTWQPTDKLSLTSALRREVAPYQDYASSYFLIDGVTFQPVWQISAKTAMRLTYDWQQRRFDGELIAGLPQRRDKLQSIRFGIDWNPRRWASLTGSFQRDTRSSNQNNLDFSANVFSLNARLNY